MTVLEPDSEGSILTMCAKGYGKRTAASDYKVQNRAGLGIITDYTEVESGKGADALDRRLSRRPPWPRTPPGGPVRSWASGCGPGSRPTST